MKKIDVDLTLFDSGTPHWLSPQGRRPDIFARNRLKHRQLAEEAELMADNKQPEPPQRTPAELNFIAWMEKWKGRPMTEQEINLSLAQARYMMGESWIDDDFGSADSQRTPAELEIIEFMQRCKGDIPLTEQEINLGLEQARLVGEL